MKRVFFLFRRVMQVLERIDEYVCRHVLNVNDDDTQIRRVFCQEVEKCYEWKFFSFGIGRIILYDDS